jgi:acyl-coenzyme A thioesterase PaaI-like protein
MAVLSGWRAHQGLVSTPRSRELWVTLLRLALDAAANSVMSPARGCAVVDQSIAFPATVMTPGGPVMAKALALRGGRGIVVARAWVGTVQGDVLVRGAMTCFIREIS